MSLTILSSENACSHGKADQLKGKVNAYWKSWFSRLGPSFTLIPAGKGCSTHAWAPAINQSLHSNGFTFSSFLSFMMFGSNRACKAAFEYLCCFLRRIFISDLWAIIFVGSLLIFFPVLRNDFVISDVTCVHIVQEYLRKENFKFTGTIAVPCTVNQVANIHSTVTVTLTCALPVIWCEMYLLG